jgi:hypothetical protein
VGALRVAVMGAAAFAAVVLYLHMGPFGSRVRFDGVLRFRVQRNESSERDIHRLLGRHCRRRVLLSVQDAGSGEAREHVYQVKFFRDADREALLAALREQLAAYDTRLLLQEATSEY